MYQVQMTRSFRKDTERCRKRGYNMVICIFAAEIFKND